MTQNSRQWYNFDGPDQRRTAVVTRVQQIAAQQAELLRGYYLLDGLYDAGREYTWRARRSKYQVSNNYVAQTTDTITAMIGKEVVPRFLADNAEWTERRRAKGLGLYLDALARHYKVHAIGEEVLKYGFLKGTAGTKVYKRGGEIRVQYCGAEDLLVPDRDIHAWQALELFHRYKEDRGQLMADFPDPAPDIQRASPVHLADGYYYHQSHDTYENDTLTCIECWRLPTGKKGSPGYRPGRHMLVVSDMALIDESWEETDFPIVVFRWTTRSKGSAGIGGGHRVLGIQAASNRLNRQVDRQQQQLAYPTTYVHIGDKSLAPVGTNDAGMVVPYRIRPPETRIPPAVSAETYARQQAMEPMAYKEVGLSAHQTAASIPRGLESGVAVREFRDIPSDRFAAQTKAYETHQLEVQWRLLRCAQSMESPPEVLARPRYGPRVVVKYRLSDVDMAVVRQQLKAISSLSRTPAGMKQLVMELAQAGVISMDEARKQLDHPDIESTMSLWTAAIDDIDWTIERILDGELVHPEPTQNLALGKWRLQQTYLRVRQQGAPEEILEALAEWLATATWMLTQAAAAAAVPPQQAAAALPGLPAVSPQEG